MSDEQPLTAAPGLHTALDHEDGVLDKTVVRRMTLASSVCGVLAAGIGFFGLLSWATGIVFLRRVVGDHSEIKPNTALGLLMCGLALCALHSRSLGERTRKWTARGLAAASMLVIAATLAEFLFSRSSGIDDILVRAVGSSLRTGRMAPHTALGLFLAGLAMLLLTLRGRWFHRFSQAFTISIGIISLITLFGYTFEISPLYKIGNPALMAVPTAIALGFFSIGMLLATPASGLFAPIANGGGGGLMLRRMLPLAIVVPWLLGWLASQGKKWGLYGGDTDDALFALALIFCFTVLLYLSARALNRLDNENERSRELLRDNSEQWQLTFNCMSEGLSYHDPDYNVVGANQAFRNLLSGQCVEDQKCYRLVHGTEAPPENCPMRKTLQTGDTAQSEIYEPRLGRHLQIRTDPVRDRAGKIFRVVHVVEDITERKKAEENIRLLAAIVESSEDAIYSTDMEGRIQSWNHGAERMYGYTASEVLGQTPAMLYPPELGSNWREIREKIHEGRSVEQPELLRIRKDGSKLYVSLSVAPLRDQKGNVIGGSGIAHDITRLKRAQEEIERAEQERSRLLVLEQKARRELERKNAEIASLNSELEERVRLRTAELEVSNKELETFSYSVSHDLRAPLRSLDGFSHILLEEYTDKLDDTGRDYLNRLRHSSQQMGHLIDALLLLSRVSRAEMNEELVDLSRMVRQIAGELRKSAPERNLEFEIADGVIATGDPRLLHILVQNLLANSWKFTSKRQWATIQFGVAEKDRKRVFFVRDNGAGFEMAYAKKLFGAFQRLHSSSEFEGSGIGLATVQRIVRRHNGMVWAEGAPNQGATFFFTLG